ncbi:protein FAM217B isoform X6 [Gallus gallus]|uniref:protein FAM217B isoform X6 n=1 Tax=Gallus gallus TaxID=9031 RepID=UPI001F013E8F|nr:protein FAM217B isoform X6 [Gallus gallus]
MGPGIQEHPLLLHQKAQKKESQINENHKGTVNYSNGKSHPSTKGVKKSVSHVKSPGRLCKNVPTTNEKTSCDAQDDNQPSVLKKGRNQPDDRSRVFAHHCPEYKGQRGVSQKQGKVNLYCTGSLLPQKAAHKETTKFQIAHGY